MSNVPTVACTNCGKNFTTDDLRGTSCKYCGTLLAHHARAQQQVAVVQQMMADRNGNGIPDMYEGVVANAQANALNQAFGMGPNPYAPPMGGMGGPMVGGPMVGGPMGMNPYAAANMQVAHAVRKTASTITIVILVSVLLMMLLSAGVGVALYFMTG